MSHATAHQSMRQRQIPLLMLVLVWTWCAVVIPLWCIIDCSSTGHAHQHPYVCSMHEQHPAQSAPPRISVDTLQALALVILIVVSIGVVLRAGNRVAVMPQAMPSWQSRPVIPPPKRLLFA